MARQFPTFAQVSQYFTTEEAAISFLIDNGIVLRERKCDCGNLVKLNTGRMSYRCGIRGCRKEFSGFKESFFYKTSLPVSDILHLAYLWLCKMPLDAIVKYTGHTDKTVSSYLKNFRKLVADSMDLMELQIGGPGVVVEVDESKFGKRKYNRGHRVEGVWILGGVERTPEKRAFLISVPDRSSETLIAAIRAYILPGSIIYSDLWKGYQRITEELEMQHYTVNHSIEFVSSEGVHTNTIEGTWNGVKRNVPVRCRVNGAIDDFLMEFLWRRQNQNSLWEGFMRALQEVAYES